MRTTIVSVMLALLFIPLAVALPGPDVTEAPALPDAAGTYFVGFYDMPTGLTSYAGLDVLAANDELRFVKVHAADAAALRAAALLDDNVRYIEQESTDWELHYVPNDYFYNHAAHWGSKRIGGEAAWDVTLGSTAIKVAHLDSGLNFGHEEFAGQSRVLQGYDFYNNDNDPDDTSGCDYHGTHTTSTAGATINNGLGIAGMSQHTILPVKIFQSSGGGPFGGCGTTTSAIIGGLQYAADQGSHLSSNSWGGGGFSTAIDDAITYAHNLGTIHVASAGNSGPCSNCVGEPWYSAGDRSIVVSSLTDGDTFSSFSSRGSQVDIIAPGDYIAGAEAGTNTYVAMSGTSMAAPHVTGSLALYMAATGNTDYATVTSALASTAEDLGLSSDRQGDGLLRVDLLVAGGSPPLAACEDGIDNDGDGLTDYPADPGCSSASDNDEYNAPPPACNDGIDNDGDGLTDYPADPGCDSASDDDETDPTGGSITLDASGYKVKGKHHIDLTWSGANGANVDIYRDGSLLTTTANDGAYTDATGNKGGRTYTHQVCEEGTSNCSAVVTTVF